MGRKPLLFVGGLVYSLGAGALIGEDAWSTFAALHFLVGFGFAAAVSVHLPLSVEITPTRHRTLLSSLMLVLVAMGTLFAASLASLLLLAIGWCGLAAIGALPVVVTIRIQIVAQNRRVGCSHVTFRGGASGCRKANGRAYRDASDAH